MSLTQLITIGLTQVNRNPAHVLRDHPYQKMLTKLLRHQGKPNQFQVTCGRRVLRTNHDMFLVNTMALQVRKKVPKTNPNLNQASQSRIKLIGCKCLSHVTGLFQLCTKYGLSEVKFKKLQKLYNFRFHMFEHYVYRYEKRTNQLERIAVRKQSVLFYLKHLEVSLSISFTNTWMIICPLSTGTFRASHAWSSSRVSQTIKLPI